jgi:hypothetical protein
MDKKAQVMGTSAGGLIIKASKSIEETSKFYFGDALTKTSYCDSRQPNCFYFGRKEGLIAIINSDFSNKLFSQNTLDDTLFVFFDKPKELFVFEEYDSGASYGYAIFHNGSLIRKIRAQNYNDIVDQFGEPIEDELEWLNGIKSNNSDGSTLIKNAVNGHEIPGDFLYKAILQLLMLKRFKFTCETMDDHFTETGHYILSRKTDTASKPKSESGKKWWKFW